jgi:hypothetical protein
MSNIRITYLREKDGYPTGCIAIDIDRDNHTISYQLSVKNPFDCYNKALARQIAIGRLSVDPIVIDVTEDDLSSTRSITYAVMKNVSNSTIVPKRAARLARSWLREGVPTKT